MSGSTTMMFATVAVLFAVLFAVLAGILGSVPLITSGPLNVTQATATTGIGSGMGLVVIVLIIIAVAGIVGAFAYFGRV